MTPPGKRRPSKFPNQKVNENSHKSEPAFQPTTFVGVKRTSLIHSSSGFGWVPLCPRLRSLQAGPVTCPARPFAGKMPALPPR